MSFSGSDMRFSGSEPEKKILFHPEIEPPLFLIEEVDSNETDGVSQTQLEEGAKRVSQSRGAAFAAAGLDCLKYCGRGLSLIGRGLSLIVGLTLFGGGFVVTGAILASRLVVKIVGRGTLGVLGYGIGKAADLLTGTKDKAGTVAKLFSAPTDLVESIIQLSIIGSGLTIVLGLCGMYLALDETQFKSFKDTADSFMSKFLGPLNAAQEEITAKLGITPWIKSEVEVIETKNPPFQIDSTSLNDSDEEVIDPFRKNSDTEASDLEIATPPPPSSIVQEEDSRALFHSHLSEDYIDLQTSAIAYLNEHHSHITWEVTIHGGIKGRIKNEEAAQATEDQLNKLISVNRGKKHLEISKFEDVIQLGNTQRRNLGQEEINCQEIFSSEYQEDLTTAINYLNKFQYPDQKDFRWEATKTGTLTCRSTSEIALHPDKTHLQISLEEWRASNSNKLRESFLKNFSLTNDFSVHFSYQDRGNWFAGSIENPADIQLLARLANET